MAIVNRSNIVGADKVMSRSCPRMSGKRVISGITSARSAGEVFA